MICRLTAVSRKGCAVDAADPFLMRNAECHRRGLELDVFYLRERSNPVDSFRWRQIELTVSCPKDIITIPTIRQKRHKIFLPRLTESESIDNQ